MAYYTEDAIEEVISNTDIVDLIGQYVPLKRRGANYLGLCPFHREKTPSFTVAPDKQIFKCIKMPVKNFFKSIISDLCLKTFLHFLFERRHYPLFFSFKYLCLVHPVQFAKVTYTVSHLSAILYFNK